MKRIHTVLNRRREADEIAPADIAVQIHCRECMGFQPSLVEGCTAPKCWLYPLRMGRTAILSESGKKPLNEIKGFAKGQARNSHAEPVSVPLEGGS